MVRAESNRSWSLRLAPCAGGKAKEAWEPPVLGFSLLAFCAYVRRETLVLHSLVAFQAQLSFSGAFVIYLETLSPQFWVLG